jgi:hypothetical protein
VKRLVATVLIAVAALASTQAALADGGWRVGGRASDTSRWGTFVYVSGYQGSPTQARLTVRASTRMRVKIDVSISCFSADYATHVSRDLPPSYRWVAPARRACVPTPRPSPKRATATSRRPSAAGAVGSRQCSRRAEAGLRPDDLSPKLRRIEEDHRLLAQVACRAGSCLRQVARHRLDCVCVNALIERAANEVDAATAIRLGLTLTSTEARSSEVAVRPPSVGEWRFGMLGVEGVDVEVLDAGPAVQ